MELKTQSEASRQNNDILTGILASRFNFRFAQPF